MPWGCIRGVVQEEKTVRHSKLATVVAIVVCFAVQTFAAPPAPAPTTTKAGSVSALLPVAHLSRGTGKAATTSDVKKGDDVFWDDVLKTEKGGRARLTLTDGSILSLGSQAELKVLKHDANSQQTSLELQYGRVRAEVNKVTQMGGSFTVKTPTAVAGVIGTDFATESGVSSTQFVCLSGNVSIGSSDPSITDKVNCLAGQVVTVEKGKAPTQPVAATPQQLQQVINDTEPGIISAVTPSLLAPGTTIDAIATGAHLENLTNASISGDGVQISIASAATSGSMTLHLVVAANATPGTRTVTLTGTNPTPTIAAFQVVSSASFAQLLNDSLQSAVGGLNGLVVGLQQTEQLALQQLQSSGIKTVDLINLKSQMDAQVKIVVDAASVAANSDKGAEATASATYTTLADAARAALLQRNSGGTPDDTYNQALAAAYTQVSGPMIATFATNQQNVGRLLENADNLIATELSDELKQLGIQAGGLGLLGEVSTDVGNSISIEATGRAGNGTAYNWGLCAAGTAGNCTPIAGQTSTSSNFVVDTCSLQPGDYRANVNFNLPSGSATSALYLLHVLPDNSPQPADILRGLADAYMNLQTQGVMGYFDQSQFSNYTQLQENVRKTFAELTSMTINVLPLSTDTKCNSAALRASWNQNYSFKTNPTIVFNQSEQLTVRLQRTPGKGWLITELQGDNGTLQGNPPGPVGSADSGARPDLDISDIKSDQGHGNLVRGRAVRANSFSGQLPPLTPGVHTYQVTFTNTSQLNLTQSVDVTLQFVDSTGGVLLTQNGTVMPPLAPAASEPVDFTVTIPQSLAGQKVTLQVIINPGCSSVIATCGGTFSQVQTVVTTPTVTVGGGPFTYDGNGHSATCTATSNGQPVSGSCTFTYNGNAALPTNAGTYAVVANFTSANPSFTNATGNGSLSINPAPSVVGVSGGPFTYDANPHSAACSASSGNLAVNGSCTFTYNGNATPPTNAGTYAVAATFTSANPNFSSGTGTGSLTINKATPTVTVTGGNFNFDGNPHGSTCSATGVGGVTVSGSCSITYNGNSAAPSAAGTYSVVGTFTSSNGNYGNGSGTAQIVINPAGTPAVSVSGGPFTYDGNPHSASCSATSNNTSVPGSCTFTYNGNSAPPINAGTYAVVANFTPSSPNFKSATGNGSLEIDKATPHVAVTGGTFNFDGNPHPATCSVTGVNNGPVNGSCSLTYNGSSTAPSNAGTYNVVASFTSADNNYNNGGGTGTIIIGSAGSPTVTVTGGPFTYDGNPHSAQCSASSGNTVVSGSCTLTYNGSSTPPTNAGTYSVAAQFTSSNANFGNATGSGTLVINKATPVVTVSGGPFTFDSNSHSATCSAKGVNNANVSGSCSFTYNGSSTAPSSVGNYTVVASFTSSDTNYSNATGQGTMIISAVGSIAVTVTGGPFTYDGNPHSATCSATANNTNVPGSCTFTYNGSPNAPINAGGYAVVANFTPSSNNFSPATGGGSITINKATPTVTVTGGPFTYDGNSHSATCTATGVNNAPVTGGCALTYGALTVAPIASMRTNGVNSIAGASGEINAGSYSVSAAFTSSDNNYTNASGNGSMTINQATPTVGVSGGPFTFDGNTHSASCSATGVNNVAVSGGCSFTYGGNPAAQSAAGTYAVVATFTSADPNYANANGNGSITINKATPTIVISGGPFAFDATPHSATCTANGVNGFIVPGTCAMTYNGSSTTPSAAGTYTVAATFTSSDSNYNNATGSGSMTINAASTPFVTVSGGPFTYDATPHSASCSATFGGQPVAGSCTFTYNGFPTPPTNAGSYSVVATFTPTSPSFTTGGGNGTMFINQAQTTTAVGTSNSSISIGTPVTFTATLSVTAPGAGSPTGTVTFKDGSTSIGTGTVSGGSASFTTSSLSAGSHTISAAYAGDTNFAGSNSTSISENVGLLTPTVTVTGGPFNYDGLQHSAACSATGAGNVAVSGSCTFTYNGNTTVPSAAGTYTVVASFTSSDPSYGNGTGNGSISINKVNLTITASSASVVFGAPAPTITAGFSGFVNSETSAVLTTQPTCGSGYTTSTNVGTSVASSCSGAAAANYNIGYVTGSVTITQAQTTTVVNTSSNTVTAGSPVTFTATLAVTAPGTGSPTGTVLFKDGTTSMGTGTVSANTASFTTSSLTTGSHSITAVYGGDTNFGASTSSAISETITSSVIDFVPTSLSLSNGSSFIQIGETGLTANVAIQNNGNHTSGTFDVGLSCGTGGPSGTLTGQSIPPKNGSANYQLPISTGALSTGSYSCTVSLTSLPGGTSASTLNGSLGVVDFTLTPFSSTAIMISGRSASFAGVTITPSNYPLTVSLSFTNTPTGLSANTSGLLTTFSGTAGAAGTGTTGITATVHGVSKTSSFAWQILADIVAAQQGNTVVTLVPPNCVARTALTLLVTTQLNASALLNTNTLPTGLTTADPNPVSLTGSATQQSAAWNLDAALTTALGSYTATATVTDAGIPATNTPGGTASAAFNINVVGAGTCASAQIAPSDGTNVGLDPSSVSFSPSLPKTGDTVEVRFRLSNTGSADARQMPVALRANGTIVAQDTFDVAAGKSTIAELQWQKASNVVSESRTLRSNSAGFGRMNLEVVVDPLNTMTQKSVNVTRVAAVSNFVLGGTDNSPNLRASTQRVMLEVADGGCAGLRFDSGPTGTCESGDVAIAVQDLGNGRFLLNANNGVSDLGSGTVAIENFNSLPFSPNAIAVAGHTYAVQLRDGSVGQLTIQSIRNPHRLTVRSGKLFRGGAPAKKIKTLGSSTDAPSTGDTSGGSTRGDSSVFFDVLFGAKAQ